ncbi:histidine phosphatase family protein [Butyrivibrio sp. AE3004]|uniref:histidine phosphatase family protein n=1 Tax=Butyrivibrio sp. AE3004 TaxID=1506994 RepID=UPI0004945078|nr:histidine phosphatase family protein [Butyrivibrio sp. AE3004]
MKLYILRHGTTNWNNKHLIQGQTDIPLDEFGKLMAAETGKGLKDKGITFDLVYSSPLIRSYETAQIILSELCSKTSSTDIIKDDRLKELHFGFMDGGKVEDMQADANSPFRYFKSAPDKYEEEVKLWRSQNLLDNDQASRESVSTALKNPELLSELYSRAKEFLVQVIEPFAAGSGEASGKSILISVHGALSKALLMHIAGESDLAKFWGEGLLPNCGISVVSLKIENGKRVYHIDDPAAIFYDQSLLNKAPKLL